jgi:hypothetical protein
LKTGDIAMRFLQIVHFDSIRILSAEERVAFPICCPARPMVRISNIGQAIFQDIKKLAPVPFRRGRNKL